MCVCGGLDFNAFYWYQIFALDTVVVKTLYFFLAWEPPITYNVSSQKNTLIKLTHYDESKKMALARYQNDGVTLFPIKLVFFF